MEQVSQSPQPQRSQGVPQCLEPGLLQVHPHGHLQVPPHGHQHGVEL